MLSLYPYVALEIDIIKKTLENRLLSLKNYAESYAACDDNT